MISNFLSISYISFYVSYSVNKSDLDAFIKYLRLETIIGGKKMEHGFGYIANTQKFDDPNVMEKLYEQNTKKTNDIINELSKTSLGISSSNFKCISVLSFDRHKNEYFASICEVAKFIIDRCLNEGTLMIGEMVVDAYEEFANKLNEITELNDSNKMFETIFYELLKNAMMRSVQKQIPEIKAEIS